MKEIRLGQCGGFRIKGRWIGLFLVFLLSFTYIRTASAQTFVSTIGDNEVWNLAGSPYVVNNLVIGSTQHLTINQGVVVKFTNTSNLDVFGELTIDGAAASPVSLTSMKDDTVGGDTNIDGSATTPRSGDWGKIIVEPGSQVNIRNAVVRYGGGRAALDFSVPTQLYNIGGVLSIDNSTFSNFSPMFLYNENGTTTITFSKIVGTATDVGIFLSHGSLSVDSTTFDTIAYGISTANANSLILTNSTFIHNVHPVGVSADVRFTHSGNSFIANDINGIDISGSIVGSIGWNVDGGAYYPNVSIGSGNSLTLDPGVVLKFKNARTLTLDGGTLIAKGDINHRITFTSLKDDVLGDTNNDGSASIPHRADWSGLILNSGTAQLDYVDLFYAGLDPIYGSPSFPAIGNYGSILMLNHTNVENNAFQGLLLRGGDTTVTDSSVSNNGIGFQADSGKVSVHLSKIEGNNIGFSSNLAMSASAENNWWGDISGPKELVGNPQGQGSQIYGLVSYIPWLNAPTQIDTVSCVTDCFSNVMFFPGIMGSRLYENTGSENELWVSASDAAQAKLSMDTQGKSVNQIYTKNDTKNNGETDETGIVDDVYGFNIYQSFIADLKDWKSQGIIKDYDFISYDWRLAPEQIVTQSTTTAGNITYSGSQNLQDSYVVKKLQELVDSSKSGKVTIIAHSNGGHVVKALVQKLKDANSPLYDKIDKIIFVAVPQVGTPDAIMGLLHGSDIGYGFIMSAERMRMLAENMPAIYNLLPSSAYFTTVSPAFAVDKVVSFENDPLFNMQISQYGMFISNPVELKNYLLGSEGRMRPASSDLVNANIGNPVVYTQAESFHQAYDTWQPAPSTKVIQVAGWGVDTIAGIDYETVAAPNNQRRATYKPRFVVDGDGTVVVPSALWMSTSTPNVERWWVDLNSYDTLTKIERVHRDIFEVSNLREFIKSEIFGNVIADSIMVNDDSVLNAGGQRLHFTLHSPLILGVTDVQGRYTGLDPISKKVREEIPNVTYKRFGDIQVISSPSDINLQLGLYGYAPGNFALDVDKQNGNAIVESVSYQGIPSSTLTSARIDIVADQNLASTSLQVDQNGDGIIDKVLRGLSGGVVIYDTSAPEISVTFSTSSRDVIFSGLDDSPVTTTQTSTSTTVTDSQGNTSVLKFTKYKEKNTKLKFAFNSITRNGVVTQLPNISVEYDWSVKNDVLTDLDTKVIIKGTEKYKFEYKKTTDTTVITDKTGKSEKKVSKKGFVPVSITTIVNEVKVGY